MTKRKPRKPTAAKRSAKRGSKRGGKRAAKRSGKSKHRVIMTGVPAAPPGYMRFVQGNSVKIAKRKVGATRGHRTCRKS